MVGIGKGQSYPDYTNWAGGGQSLTMNKLLMRKGLRLIQNPCARYDPSPTNVPDE